jgi:hypothetical protein
VATLLILTWDANPVMDNVTQYNVYRVRKHGGSDTIVGSTTPPVVTFNTRGFIVGSSTNFYVTAVNSIGESLKSNTVTASSR